MCQPSIRSEPSLVGMGSEAGGGPGLMTSPKQRATQKLRPVLPGHPGMLCRVRKVGVPEENIKVGGGGRKKKCQASIRFIPTTYLKLASLTASVLGAQLWET